jgi:hypothetical protein
MANVRDRMAVRKQRSHRFHMERFNLNKLNEIGRQQLQHVKMSNTNIFTALESSALRWILTEPGKLSQKIPMFQQDSLGYYELKKHKPWFNKG